MDFDVIKEIGMPAMLEQCAEECTELAHACLKLSRKMRDENPTPKTEQECTNDLAEEMGDVMLCMRIILDSDELISWDAVESWYLQKDSRMKKRLAERKAEQIRAGIDDALKGE